MTIKKKQKKEDKMGVVYEIPCHKCKQSYIGQTGRTLSKRIKEHKYEVCSMNINNLLVHGSPCKLGGINSYWPGRTPCKKKI